MSLYHTSEDVRGVLYSGIHNPKACLFIGSRQWVTPFLGPTTARAGTDLKFSYIKILVSYLRDVLLTKIAVKDGVVLIRRRQYILNAKCSVPESHVPGCQCFATAPTAFDLEMFMHEDSKQSLTLGWSVNKSGIECILLLNTPRKNPRVGCGLVRFFTVLSKTVEPDMLNFAYFSVLNRWNEHCILPSGHKVPKQTS